MHNFSMCKLYFLSCGYIRVLPYLVCSFFILSHCFPTFISNVVSLCSFSFLKYSLSSLQCWFTFLSLPFWPFSCLSILHSDFLFCLSLESGLASSPSYFLGFRKAPLPWLQRGFTSLSGGFAFLVFRKASLTLS